MDSVVEETGLNAAEKINKAFSEISQYKVQRKELFIMMLKTLYSSANLVFRDKMVRSRIKVVAPKLTKIIFQGVEQKIFKVISPDYAAEIILQLLIYLGEDFSRMIFKEDRSTGEMKKLVDKCSAYERAVERILGAKENTIHLIPDETIKQFYNKYKP